MGITSHGGTMGGGVTPTCNECGVALCWDIGRTEYLEAKPFWDAWRCQDCNGSRLSAHGWSLENGRESLPAAIEAVITAFDDAHPQYRDATGRDRSAEASHALCSALETAGFGSTIVRIGGTDHFGVEIGAMTIDWTAVQVDEDAPTPLVYRTSNGWPIEPATGPTIEEIIAALTPERLAALRARLAA